MEHAYLYTDATLQYTVHNTVVLRWYSLKVHLDTGQHTVPSFSVQAGGGAPEATRRHLKPGGTVGGSGVHPSPESGCHRSKTMTDLANQP